MTGYGSGHINTNVLRSKSISGNFDSLTINLPFKLLTTRKALIRKTWPKIRVVEIKGQVFYRVDARRTGTSGRQESFKSKKEAEERAAEIATQFGAIAAMLTLCSAWG